MTDADTEGEDRFEHLWRTTEIQGRPAKVRNLVWLHESFDENGDPDTYLEPTDQNDPDSVLVEVKFLDGTHERAVLIKEKYMEWMRAPPEEERSWREYLQSAPEPEPTE